MTEEDTFLALKRIPFEKVFEMWRAVDMTELNKFPNSNTGWTWKEFFNEFNKQHDIKKPAR